MTQHASRIPTERELDAGLAESFPASDPPAHRVEQTDSPDPETHPSEVHPPDTHPLAAPSPLTSPQPVAEVDFGNDLGGDLTPTTPTLPNESENSAL